MSSSYLLFWVIVSFCGVIVLSYPYEQRQDFNLQIIKRGNKDNFINLFQYFRFEEGLEHLMARTSPPKYDVHCEVQPNGFNSTTGNNSSVTKRNEISMVLRLNRNNKKKYRDGVIYYAKNKKCFRWKKKSTIIWKNTNWIVTSIPPTFSPFKYTRDAEKTKCYQQNEYLKCDISIPSGDKSTAVFLHIYAQFNHTLNQGVIDETNKLGQTSPVDDNEKSENKYGWVKIFAGVAGVALLLGLCFICYRLIKKRKQNKPTHTEPPIVYAGIQMENDDQRGRRTWKKENNAEPTVTYAELQLESNGQRRHEKRNGENSHYAKIWFKPKKNVPKIKNAPENTRSRTENTRIGTVEKINDLYSTAEDTRNGGNPHYAKIWFKSKKNVPKMKNSSENTRIKTEDTRSKIEDTRIGTVEKINELYSTVEHTRIGTVERINDLYLSVEDTRNGTVDNPYTTIWR